MKDIRKILTVLVICVAMALSFAVAAIASDGEYTGTVEKLTELVEKAETASTSADKNQAVNDIVDYYVEVDPESDGYDDLIKRTVNVMLPLVEEDLAQVSASGKKPLEKIDIVAAADARLSIFPLDENAENVKTVYEKFDEAAVIAAKDMLTLVDENVTETGNVVENSAALNNLKNFINKHTTKLSDPEVAYSEIYEVLPALEAANEQAIADKYAELDEENILENYDFEKFEINDFNSHNVHNISESGKYIDKFSGVMNDTSAQKFGIAEEANGNKYLYMSYSSSSLDAANNNNGYIHSDMSGYAMSNGIVIEFDLTTFTSLPDDIIKVEPGGVDTDNGRDFPTPYFQIDSQGSIIFPKNKSTGVGPITLAERVVVPGEWVHFILVLDPVNFTSSLYVNGVYLDTASMKIPGKTYNMNKMGLRFNITATDGQIAIDNVKFYDGLNYRDLDKLNNMNSEELFMYYTDYLNIDKQDINGKYSAYVKLGEMIGQYWSVNEETGEGSYIGEAVNNTEIQDAIASYLAFDYDAMVDDVKDGNLQRYKEMVLKLSAMARTAGNVSERVSLSNEINTFMLTYQELINKELDSNSDGITDFSEHQSIYRDLAKKAEYDKNADEFIRAVERFQIVSVVSSLERYYNKAKELVDGGLIDIDLGTDPDHPDRDNFEKFVKSYEIFLNAEGILKQKQREDTSYKIVRCMSIIIEYDTEAEWLENYELIDKYLNIAKNDVLGRDEKGNLLYDTEYEGIDEAIEYFNDTYEYFYNRLQQRHIEYLSGLLDDISATDAYIEKIGITFVIRRYFAVNDIDYTNSEIATILSNLDTCEEELKLREEDYAKILTQNSVYFINIVERMRTSSTYEEKKMYFDQASLYYFNSDSLVEGTAEAIEIYDKFKIELERNKEASDKFIEAVEIYKTVKDKDEQYAILVACYNYSQDVDLTYPGAKAAMNEYKTAYDEYVEYADLINGEIATTGNAVGSLRTNSGITNVISIIIKSIFGI